MISPKRVNPFPKARDIGLVSSLSRDDFPAAVAESPLLRLQNVEDGPLSPRKVPYHRDVACFMPANSHFEDLFPAAGRTYFTNEDVPQHVLALPAPSCSYSNCHVSGATGEVPVLFKCQFKDCSKTVHGLCQALYEFHSPQQPLPPHVLCEEHHSTEVPEIPEEPEPEAAQKGPVVSKSTKKFSIDMTAAERRSHMLRLREAGCLLAEALGRSTPKLNSRLSGSFCSSIKSKARRIKERTNKVQGAKKRGEMGFSVR
ncbi:hypothetical protein CYMTET_56701, partial [Cymbomonas tetramitiformis]